MRFVLTGDWPCQGGALCVPAGTVIEWDPGPGAARLAGIGTYPQWQGAQLPLPMPLNAKCLDQEAYDQMSDWYASIDEALLRHIHYGPNVKPKGQ
jgi:hypothetical protein